MNVKISNLRDRNAFIKKLEKMPYEEIENLLNNKRRVGSRDGGTKPGCLKSHENYELFLLWVLTVDILNEAKSGR